MIDVIEGVLFTVITCAVLMAAAVTEPRLVRCPPNWYVMGVPPSGRTTCNRPSRDELDESPEPSIGVRIYCTNNQRPIVRDFRTIGCQARH